MNGPGFIVLGLAAWTATRGEAAPFDYDAFLRGVQVPPEFTLELAAGEPDIRFPMFACFDDDGRLYVAESSGRDLYAGLQQLTRDCRVTRLEDTNQDGRFERATVFQEGVTFPMGLAWHEGRLYLADPPELIALTDSDGDGRADQREVILSGFGHTDNGSLHGLTFGPDGLLYFTMGEPDGWKLPHGDGTFLEGRNGALFRCRPDGSRPEVISRGFVNLVEIEFLPGGEFIGTDNWFQKPAGGYRDALVDCAPGGLFPYAPDSGTPLPRTGVTLPPLTLLPAVAHSGVMRPRGSGLPAEWRDSLFAAQFNTRKIVRHEMHRAGSTFAATNLDFIVGEAPDFHPSDVLEDADGSLLIVDTGGWYVEHCPTGRIRDSRAPGGIYRVRWKRAPQATDPRGQSLNWREVTTDELVQRLSDPRFVVADRAARELVRRQATEVLTASLRGTGNPAHRTRALWSLAQLSDEQSLAAIRDKLDDADSTIVTAAARALGSRGDMAAGDRLVRLLESTNAPVRRAAAEALARCGSQAHRASLVSALARAGDDFEEHACILALFTLTDEAFARDMLEHDSPRVRRAALHLLDQPPLSALRFNDLVASLGTDDAALRRAALGLFERHPSWAADALPWLREQLIGSPANPEQASSLRGLIAAFQGDASVRDLITEFIEPDAATSETTRAFLLGLLPSFTAQPPESAWLRAIPEALNHPPLRAAGLSAAAAYPQPEWQPLLAKLAEDSEVPGAQRLLAARLTARQPQLSQPVFTLALASLDANASAPDRLAAVDLLIRVRLVPAQLVRLLAVLQSGSAVSPDPFLPVLARAANDATRPALADFFTERIRTGWSPNRSTLDQVLAVFPGDAPVRATLLAAWERNMATLLQRLAEFKPLLTGGDPGRGRELFTVATCAGCHRIGERGGESGPDLTKIGAIRSGGDLLESILFPSSSFAQGFEPYALTRRDGEEVIGSLVAQGPEGVTLRDATGFLHRVPAAGVASLDRLQLSAMPEGLDQLLTRGQFRDLLAYLQSLK